MNDLLTIEQLVLLRTKVREALAILPGFRRATEKMLVESVALLVPFEVSAVDMRAAIDWNQEKGFIDYKWNGDFEREEWFCTERGRAKDGR